MKKPLSLMLSVLILSAPVFAYENDRSEGMHAAKNKMQTALAEISQKEPASLTGDMTYKTLAQISAKLDSKYYNNTLQSDFAKAKILEMLGQLAITSAYSIGTAEQQKQMALVYEQAAALKGSNDSAYREIGAKFEALAKSMEEGNEVEAQTIAQEIKESALALAPEIPADYRPTQKENQLLTGLASVLSNSLGRIMNMLGTFALSSLFKTLGFGALASNPIGMAIAIVMQSTLGAVAQGITGGQVNWTPVEQAAVNQTMKVGEFGADKVEQSVQTGINEAEKSFPSYESSVGKKDAEEISGGILPTGK